MTASAHRLSSLRSRSAQRGQSLLEFIVLALVLVPLFIALPLLGKYLDLAHSTELAARYLVFEATVSDPEQPKASDEMRALELRQRFFGRSDAPIRSLPASADAAAQHNPLWSDHRGDALLAATRTDVEVHSDWHRRSAPAGAFFAGDRGFDLPQHNELHARVIVRPRDIAGFVPLHAIGLQIARHHRILTDPWTATSSASVSRRIENATAAVYPIAPLKRIGDTLGSVLPPLMLDPRMRVGKVDAEIVPCDRLVPRC